MRKVHSETQKMDGKSDSVKWPLVPGRLGERSSALLRGDFIVEIKSMIGYECIHDPKMLKGPSTKQNCA